jgi:hypothetical protein
MPNKLLMLRIQAYITLPPFLNLTIIKTKKFFIIYTYNNFFFYQLSHCKDLVYIWIDIETKSLGFQTLTDKTLTKLYFILLEKFFFSWDSYFFEKIKFKGKGYRIAFKKKKKIMKFYFGHSHKTIFIFRWTIIKKPHKYKFIILQNNLTTLKKLNHEILKIKPLNIYTKRGLRNFRQIIYKRKGKKSSY